MLSGSNDWDYAPRRARSACPQRWHWDPLRDARLGGMGQLARAVRRRMSPFLGFCGGAQILGLLEAEAPSHELSVDDEALIDEVLRRATGKPIRGFAPPTECERAWPATRARRARRSRSTPTDPLFADLAGAAGRSTTQELPLSHADAVRADAFLPEGRCDASPCPATSTFCAPEGDRRERARRPLREQRARAGAARCRRRSARGTAAWPIIGAQFHAEQRDFAVRPRRAIRRSRSPTRGSFWRPRTSSSSTPT